MQSRASCKVWFCGSVSFCLSGLGPVLTISCSLCESILGVLCLWHCRFDLWDLLWLLLRLVVTAVFLEGYLIGIILGLGWGLVRWNCKLRRFVQKRTDSWKEDDEMVKKRASKKGQEKKVNDAFIMRILNIPILVCIGSNRLYRVSAVGPTIPQQANNGRLDQTVVTCFVFSLSVHGAFCFSKGLLVHCGLCRRCCWGEGLILLCGGFRVKWRSLCEWPRSTIGSTGQQQSEVFNIQVFWVIFAFCFARCIFSLLSCVCLGGLLY